MDYAKAKIKADKLLKKHGMIIPLERYESAGTWEKEYDPIEGRDKWTNSVTGEIAYSAPTNTPTEYKFYGIRTYYRAHEIDGTLIKRGDVRLVLSTDFPEPQLEDKFTVSNVKFNYVDHEEKAPADIGLVYIVQARK